MSIKKEHIGILLIATTMLLSACSSDDAGVQTDTTGNESAGKVVQLVSYISPFVEKELSHRAAPTPTGFSAYTPDKPTNMGVYMLLSENWASPEEKIIRYNTTTSKWQSNFELIAEKSYTVYGYMPKTEDMASSLTKSTENAATLTITGMKAITTDDICIITGVKETDEGLKEGQFSWNTPLGNETFYINILMDHLYASVQFSMKIDAEYASLRTIKLKTMTLSANKGSVNATISLTHNDTGASPITGVTYTPSGNSGEAEIFNSDEGTPLDKTEPLTINACYVPLPTLSNNLTLVTTYDVYDRKGNLIRKNRSAINKLPNLDAVRGQRVQVNMTVNPTYLYVLSDPDLDNPTITIN